MPLSVAQLVNDFEESKTLALVARAKKMKSEGRSIISFAAGEPDFNTPDFVCDAASQAMKNGMTKYTPVAGLPEVRKAVALRLSKDYQFDFAPEGVVLSTGGKQAIYHAMQAILNQGDEVLIAAPYWTSFPEMVKLVQAKPVIVHSEGYRLKAKDLQNAVTKKTKMFIFNNPSNPVGSVFSRAEIQSFIEALKGTNICWILDDTYYGLVYPPNEWISPLVLEPELAERSVVVGSASKSYAMTGWRIGWSVSPEPIAAAITKLQGQVTSNPSSVSQMALFAALEKSEVIIEDFRGRFQERRQFLLERLAKIPGLSWLEPEGAFYCFIRLSEVVQGSTVTAFCERLLLEHGVCLVPGEAFGAPEFARLSYACSKEQIEEGLSRLEKALNG